MERIMDVELFLGIQGQWVEDSQHRVVIIHEMFWHAATKGQKEARMDHLPRLLAKFASAEPRGRHTCHSAGGPETSKEELQELCLVVYKLHRLPRSPPGEPVLLEEVLSSLKDHQGQKGGKGIYSHHEAQLKKTPIPQEAASPRKERETAW